MRFMTMNVYSPGNPRWGERQKVLQAGFADLAPDIVAVQEAGWDDGADPVVDLLGDRYHSIAHPETSSDGVGAFLASKYPLEMVSVIDLRLTERVTLPWAGAVIAAVDAPEPWGRLLVVHYKPTWEIGFSLERELQAVACATAVEEIVGGEPAHVVIMGDFDDEPHSASMRFWRGQQSLNGTSDAYTDTWEAAHPNEPGFTFSASNDLVQQGEFSRESDRRIDYILIRCGRHGPTLSIEACHLAFETPWEGLWASDHFGIVADLEPI